MFDICLSFQWFKVYANSNEVFTDTSEFFTDAYDGLHVGDT